MLKNSVTAQNVIDIPNFPDSRPYAKVLGSQLVFCYHVLQCLIPVSQAVVFRRAVVFYVQAKKAWERKKNLQQGWHSILQKLLVLIFLVPKNLKNTTWHFPKISPFFELASFLSRKIDRKVLQTAQPNCFNFCQKGEEKFYRTYNKPILQRSRLKQMSIRVLWNHSKTHRALGCHVFDLVDSKCAFSLLHRNWTRKIKSTDMVAFFPEQQHL